MYTHTLYHPRVENIHCKFHQVPFYIWKIICCTVHLIGNLFYMCTGVCPETVPLYIHVQCYVQEIICSMLCTGFSVCCDSVLQKTKPYSSHCATFTVSRWNRNFLLATTVSWYRRPGFKCAEKWLRLWGFKVDCEFNNCVLYMLCLTTPTTWFLYVASSASWIVARCFLQCHARPWIS